MCRFALRIVHSRTGARARNAIWQITPATPEIVCGPQEYFPHCAIGGVTLSVFGRGVMPLARTYHYEIFHQFSPRVIPWLGLAWPSRTLRMTRLFSCVMAGVMDGSTRFGARRNDERSRASRWREDVVEPDSLRVAGSSPAGPGNGSLLLLELFQRFDCS